MGSNKTCTHKYTAHPDAAFKLREKTHDPARAHAKIKEYPMDTRTLVIGLCAVSVTLGAFAEPAPPPPPKQKPIVVSQETAGETTETETGREERSNELYPSNWGHVGLFRVRSAESLPLYTLAFGIGGEFYSVSNAPTFSGSSQAKTIAESLFVGFSPAENVTVGITRTNSSTTFGNPQQLISSLGDFNFSGMYSFQIGNNLTVAPIANILIASNFNNLAPSGNTVSAGLGAAATYSLFEATGAPIHLHANFIYHMPQIRTNQGLSLQPETFFPFSRYHTITLGLGAEWQLGDIIPFMEFHQEGQADAGISYFSSPSRLSLGARFTPLSNKSLALLLGADVGLGKALVAGVPFNPDYQVIAQASYTVAITQTERKHYQTSQDVNIVDRRFVIRKKIRFKVNSAELDPSSTDLLNQIADVVKRNKVKKLMIVGHTDSTASENYNLKLSQDRAQSVRQFLINRGISGDTLLAQGYGKRQPIASNATEEGRSKNRRVEFFILE